MPKRTHNMSSSREYMSYYSMLTRCYNQNHHKFKTYGGIGIKVSESWRASFSAFFKDMGVRPKGMTLDRIKRGEGYSKENCRWASITTQNRNRKCVKLSEEKVKLIREMISYDPKAFNRKWLGKCFGVSVKQITKIKHNRAWVLVENK